MKQSTLGFTAMAITLVYTGASLPVQICATWAEKDASSLSLFMLIMMSAAFCSWTLYACIDKTGGIGINWHIFIPNLLGALCALILLTLKLVLHEH